MEGEPILKKTLVTMAAMVGACVLFVGTLSIGAVLVTSHAVGADNKGSSSEPTMVPMDKVPGASSPGARPLSPTAKPPQQI